MAINIKIDISQHKTIYKLNNWTYSFGSHFFGIWFFVLGLNFESTVLYSVLFTLKFKTNEQARTCLPQDNLWRHSNENKIKIQIQIIHMMQ